MKSLLSFIAILLVVTTIIPSSALSESKENLIRVPEDEYAAQEKPRPEADLKKEGAQLEEALKRYNSAKDFKNVGLTYLSLGRVYEGLRQFDKVGECYEKAFAAFTKIGDPAGTAHASSNLGWLRWKFGQYDEAVEFYEKTLEAAGKMGDAKSEARTLYALGCVYHLQDDWGQREKVLQLYEKALAIFTRIGDAPGEAQTLLSIGDLFYFYINISSRDKPLPFYSKAVEATRKIGDVKREAAALHRLGITYQNLKQYDNAVASYEKALAIRKQIDDPKREAQYRGNLADLHVKLGQFDKAFGLYEEALERAKRTGNAEVEAKVLEDLGGFWQKQSQHEKATVSYERALAIQTKMNDVTGEARIGDRLTEVDMKRGQPDKALTLHEKAIETAIKAGNKREEAHALHDIGYIYELQARYDKAVEFYHKALTIRTASGDAARQLLTLYKLAKLRRYRLKETDKALALFEKAVEIARNTGNHQLEAEAFKELGYASCLADRYDMSVESYQKALAIRIQLGDASDEMGIRGSIQDAYRRRESNKAKLTGEKEKAVAAAKKTGDRKAEAQALNNLGNAYSSRGKSDEAVVCWTKALSIWTDLKDRRCQADCLKQFGYHYAGSRKYDMADEYLEKAFIVARELKDSELQKELLQSGSGFVFLAEMQAEAPLTTRLRAYERVRSIAHELKEVALEGYALQLLGGCYATMGQYHKGLEFLNKSLAISNEFKFTGFGAATISVLRSTYLSLGEYDRAQEVAEKEVAIARSIRHPSSDREAAALNGLGGLYDARGQYQKALGIYEESLDSYRRIGDTTGEGVVLNNLGRVYSAWGRYDKALECYEASLYRHRSRGKPLLEGDALQNLGIVYGSLGHYDKALECYEKNLDVLRKARKTQNEAATLMIMGQVLERRGDHAQALKNYEEGLAVYSKAGLATNWPKCLIGNLYLDTGDIARAEPLLKEAGYSSALGRLSLAKAEYDKAKKYYEDVLQVAEKSKNADDLFTAYTGLGLSYEGIKDDRAAAEYFRKAVQLVEDLRSRVTPENRERFLDVKVNGFYRTSPYEGLARVLIRLNKPSEAWKTSEYTKARLFAESMSARAGNQTFDLPKDVIQADEELNNQLAAMKRNRQTAYENDDKEALASLDPKVKALEGKFQAHVKMIREKYPIFAASKYPEPMDLSQTALKADEWVLSYDVGDPGLIIYLTKGKTLKKALFKLIPRKDLDTLVRKFREPLDIKSGERIEERISKFDFASGKKLADILLADILPELPKDAPLIIRPADCLGVLPFEMLVLNDGGKVSRDKKLPYTTGAEFFGDRNPISYYQSVTALTLARNFGKQKGSETKRLVMSDPIFDLQDQRLKDFEAQKKESLMKALPQQLMAVKQENRLEFPRLLLTGDLGKALEKMDPAQTELCTGMDASKPALFKKPLDKYKSLVFATHGYFGKDLAGIQEPVLVLTQVDQPQGQDGFLRLSEVMGLKLNADIVALTACQTGLGRQISGEGTMGMGRAFQYAGAKSVLMSLWSVSENASVKLVESFFRNMKQGKSRLESLKLARDEIRKDGFDHPFYWAPFILVGEVN